MGAIDMDLSAFTFRYKFSSAIRKGLDSWNSHRELPPATHGREDIPNKQPDDMAARLRDLAAKK